MPVSSDPVTMALLATHTATAVLGAATAAEDFLLGLACVGSFLLLVALLLVWTFVIAPRRARRLLQELAESGYVEIEAAAPELQAAVQTLAPILLEGTVRFEEGSRRILNGLIRQSGGHPRFVVNTAHTDEAGSDAITIWQTLVLESRPLGLDTEFSVRRTRLGWVGREARFGFREVTVPGLSPEFTALFSVYSRDGREVSLSPPLQRALLEVASILPDSSQSNTRFGPHGWGISASGAWLDRKALRALLDAADRISGAL